MAGAATRGQTDLRPELTGVDSTGRDPADPLPGHRKMAASPFRFTYGAAQVFYADSKAGRPSGT